MPLAPIVAGGLVALVLLYLAFVRWGTRWGATKEECEAAMPGDRYFGEGQRTVRLTMTRAVTVSAPPETVWPWLAQLGRGAGFYSLDRIDNGGKRSACHIVSWIPEPRLGDASAIGYLRDVVPGEELGWWVPGEPFAGSLTRMAISIRLSPREGDSPRESASRLVVRVDADAAGWTARPLMAGFAIIDTIMARRQLLGVRRRAETWGDRRDDPSNPESGARDQYQLYEAVYASGEKAGVAGREKAALWREAALKSTTR